MLRDKHSDMKANRRRVVDVDVPGRFTSSFVLTVVSVTICIGQCAAIDEGSSDLRADVKFANMTDCRSQCINNGTCTLLNNVTTCVCDESFTGTFCESFLGGNVAPTELTHSSTDPSSVTLKLSTLPPFQSASNVSDTCDCTGNSAAGLSYKSWTIVTAALGFLFGSLFGIIITFLHVRRRDKFVLRTSKPVTRTPYFFSNNSVDGVFQQISREASQRTPEAAARTRLNSVTKTLSHVYRRFNRNSWTQSEKRDSVERGNGATDTLELADIKKSTDADTALQRSLSSKKLIVPTPEHKPEVLHIDGGEMRERTVTTTATSTATSNTRQADGNATCNSQTPLLSTGKQTEGKNHHASPLVGSLPANVEEPEDGEEEKTYPEFKEEHW